MSERCHTYGDFVEDVVQERFERISGVARSNAFGCTEREMQIIVDPESLARYGPTVTNFINDLRQANASISAGDVEEGKGRYVVRAEGEFSNIDAVMRSDQSTDAGASAGSPCATSAPCGWHRKMPTARISYLGQQAIAVNVQRETGANVIETMAGVRIAVAELNERFLDDQQLILTQVL